MSCYYYNLVVNINIFTEVHEPSACPQTLRTDYEGVVWLLETLKAWCLRVVSSVVSTMSSLASNRVFLKRQGRRVELQLEQVTVDHLRRILQVDPTDVWLLDDLDDTAFFPDDDGTFRGLSCLRTLEVQGPSVASPELGSSSNGVTVSATSTSSGPHVTPRPQFKSVISSRGKNYPVFRLKVVKAIMEGGGGGKCKPSFQTIQQTYIELQESTANVHYVRDEVSRTWGSLYVLVTSDGLQLEDSPATRG